VKKIRQRQQGGFTLLEAMIAMVVLLVALVGALAGLISSSQEFRAGQIRQAEMALIEAKSQRMMLMDHSAGPVSWPSALQWTNAPLSNSWAYQAGPEFQAPGTNMWVVDPDPAQCPVGCTVVGPLDLSVGAYFIITPDGRITPDNTVTAGTPCNDSSIPVTTFCRELVVGQGIETSSGNLAAQALPLNHTGYTVWFRVVRNGQQATNGDQFFTDPITGYITSVGTVFHHDVWVN
jgi:prepilin-type N-terminal cleavage/methylation domain-containing protein